MAKKRSDKKPLNPRVIGEGPATGDQLLLLQRKLGLELAEFQALLGLSVKDYYAIAARPEAPLNDPGLALHVRLLDEYPELVVPEPAPPRPGNHPGPDAGSPARDGEPPALNSRPFGTRKDRMRIETARSAATAATPGRHFVSITTSRYSPGTTSELDPPTFKRSRRAVMSSVKLAWRAGSRAAYTLWVGP